MNKLFRLITYLNGLFIYDKGFPTQLDHKIITENRIQKIKIYCSKDANIGNFLFVVLAFSIMYFFASKNQKYVEAWGKNIPLDYFISAVILIIGFRSIVNILDKRPKLIIDENGIWVRNLGLFDWGNIEKTNTLKKIDDSNEFYYLILIHKNHLYKIYINDLEFNRNEISHYIEFFKIKYINKEKELEKIRE